MRGMCPECGVAMRKMRFVDAWSLEGEPEEFSGDWVCVHCGIRWVALGYEPGDEELAEKYGI